MSKEGLAWILFDLDNTLLDFNAASHEALKKIASIINIPADESFYQTYEKVNGQIWQELELGIITPSELKKQRFARLGDEYDRKFDGVALNRIYLKELTKYNVDIPGSREILEKLKDQYSLGIITNGLKEVQRPRLRKSGLENYFSLIVVSDEIGTAKPANSFFTYVHNKIAEPNKNRVMVIGDRLSSDIKGANDFGYISCWYNPMNNEPNDIKPDYEFADFNDLQEILDKVNMSL